MQASMKLIRFTEDDPDFWIQVKGNSAGKPLKNKIPNSIGIKANPSHLVSDFLFYTIEYLFQSGAFKPHLKGSVVPFINNRAITLVLVEHWLRSNRNA